MSWCLGHYEAVIIAFLLATIDLLRRASRPGTWVLKEAPDGSHFVPEETDHVPDTSGIIIYRFGAPLYFANATLFEEEVEKLVMQATTPVKWFVLDAEAMIDIDTTGEEVLHQVLTWLDKRGVSVAVSRANQSTSALLDALSSTGTDWGKPAVPDQPSCDRGISTGNGTSDVLLKAIASCRGFKADRVFIYGIHACARPDATRLFGCRPSKIFHLTGGRAVRYPEKEDKKGHFSST